MLKKVKNKPHVTFVGVPGSGKTATARHIALMLQQEGYEIVPIKDIRKIEDYCDPRNPQVFVVDDVVGVFGLQNTKLYLLTDYKDRIMKPVMSKSKTIMTCREAVYRESLESSSFFTDENNTVLLHSEANALTNTDKKCLLKMYNIDVDLLSPENLTSASKMFPYLCKVFSNEKKFQFYGPAFFENPVPCILRELEEMRKENKIQYTCLVLCMMNENKISEKNPEDRNVLEQCKVSSHTDNFKFVDALSEMEGTYTKLRGTEYSFVHDSMFEIVAHHFGSKFQELILKFMSSNYIANNVKVQECLTQKIDKRNEQVSENAPDSGGREQRKNSSALSNEYNSDVESFDLCIRLKEKHYPMLAERLYRDIENMELYDVFMNNVLKDPKVYQTFEEVLKRKSDTELMSLFLTVQKNIAMVVSKGERVRVESTDWGWELNRQEVLVNEEWKGSEPTYNTLNTVLQSPFGFNTYRDTPLTAACQGGHVIVVKELLMAGADVNQQGKRTTPLIAACMYGHMDVVKKLREAGADVNVEVCGDIPLTAACQGGHISIVKELLKDGADVNQQGAFNSPLLASCKSGHMEVVQELIEAGADVNVELCGDTPLTAACEGGHKGVVKELIKAKAYVNLQDEYNTPLSLACSKGNMTIVEDLIKAGADVNLQVSIYTPLVAASMSEQESVVSEPPEAGANVNPRSFFTTPLTTACGCGHLHIVQKLLEAGAEVNLKGKYDTPLTEACKGGHMSIVEKLLKAGADVNIQDFEGRTPLYTILLNSTETVIPVELMVNSYGADPTICDREGFSAILITLIKSKFEFVNKLIQTENDSQFKRVKLHLFDCLVNIRHSDVMFDSKDDVVVQKGRVFHMRESGFIFKSIMESKCDVLKYLLDLGLDVNQWIQLYDDYNSHFDVKPFLFTLIDEGLKLYMKSLVEKVRILLEAGADVNVRVKYRKYLPFSDRWLLNNDMFNPYNSDIDDENSNMSLLDKEGLSVLERTRRLLGKFSRKKCFFDEEILFCKKVFDELKKHVRRYSV
ncbi:uncharacterized protein LOC133198482 [Saccostrea echinata]|uniref:uncharacterized protein LOC133198482 n=1 Tax=Saccostrea echinata TaxID=191078 RepID=UPI002A7FF6EE|nr:uncharacterized protein LOC133198482 [Saccostrea echinata]